LNISRKNLQNILRLLKKEAGKGTLIKVSEILKCQYNYCEAKNFKKGEEVVHFFNCLHFFHKDCFDKLNITYPSHDISKIDKNCSETDEYSNYNPQINIHKNIFKMTLECKICSKTSLE
jgi:hypothetical protein